MLSASPLREENHALAVLPYPPRGSGGRANSPFHAHKASGCDLVRSDTETSLEAPVSIASGALEPALKGRLPRRKRVQGAFELDGRTVYIGVQDPTISRPTRA